MSAKHTVEHQLLQRMAPMLLALESIVAPRARRTDAPGARSKKTPIGKSTFMKTISCFVTFVLIFVVLGRAADAPSYGFTLQETERYIVWPGQACSYMIGQLRILELREKAKTMLGPKFSLKAFHNLVLRGGSMPLDVLAAEVDAWIAAAK